MHNPLTSHRLLTVAVVGAIAALSQAPTVVAQEGVLEEVIVKAQRRDEMAQDVPISITTLGADMLERANVSQLTDIAELTPGLRFDSSSAFTQPTIRGVGNSVVSSGATSNVGLYVDGFYVPNPLSVDFQLMNLESIQVLKGPQGTLFGRNSTGGAILVVSAKPQTETTGNVELSYGSYNTRRAGAYGTTGLSENVAIDGEFVVDAGDGYWDNIVTGNDDDAKYNNWSGRLGLAADLSESSSLLLRYLHHDVDDGRPMAYNSGKIDGQFIAPASTPASALTADPDKIAVQLPMGFTSETDAVQLTLEFDLDFAHLTSYTQYREDDSRMIQDNDGTGALVTQIDINVQDKTTSQEFLLASTGDGPLQWTTGLFYFEYEDTFFPVDAIIPPFGITQWTTIAGSTTTSNTLAAYIDGTYQLTDRLFLTAGMRYSRDEVKDAAVWAGTMVGVDDYDDSRVTPRLVLRYELTDSSSVYASYTQGYKAGFLDVANPAPAEEVKPEEIDAYEVGYKYAGERLAVDVATYYYDYQDLQVSIYPQGTAITVNAATATIRGLEGQLRYAISDQFQVSASGAWIDAEYDKFPNYFRFVEVPGFGFFTPTGFDASGMTMQRTPKFSGNLSANYQTPVADGTLELSGSLYYTSKFYFEGSEYVEEGAYATLGLRAGWTDASERYTLSLYGDNMTDEEYRVQASGTFSGLATIWAPPRTLGAAVKYNF